MDMVAEAKKRVEKRWRMDYDEDGQSFFLVQEGFTYALIERGYPNDEVDADFIAEAPAFIVAQDERIKELEKRYALYRELCNESIDEYKSVVRAFLEALGEQGTLHNEIVKERLYTLKDLVV